jgi:hypothetical protein
MRSAFLFNSLQARVNRGRKGQRQKDLSARGKNQQTGKNILPQNFGLLRCFLFFQMVENG